MRDVGTMAQAKLEEWAAQVSITSNIAYKDKEGWDYLLQFPVPQEKNELPLDLKPTRIECLVQVKGKENKKKRKSIKLSNWAKLVSSPLPAFFLIIYYGKGVSPKEAFLIEVNEKWISKVMERLRKVPDEKKNQLNKMSMDLKWSKEDRLETLDGKGLKAAIEKAIGDDYDFYVSEKQRLKKEVGQDAPYIIHFTSQAYEDIDAFYSDWIDFAIGVMDDLPISKMLIEKGVRFGIPQETIEEDEGILSIIDRSNTGKPITLALRNENNTLRTTFPALLFTPDHFFAGEEVPKDIRKVRISSEIGDIIFKPHTEKKTTEFKLKISHDNEPGKLNELANLWRIIPILSNSKYEKCFIEISDDEHEPFLMQIASPKNIQREFLIVSMVVENALYLAKILDIPSDIEVTLDQLLSQHKLILETRKLYDHNIPIDFISGSIPGDMQPSGKEQAVIASKELIFGTITNFLLFGFAGSAEFKKTNDVKEFRITKPRRIHFSSYSADLDEDQSIQELINELSETLEEKGYDVIIFRD